MKLLESLYLEHLEEISILYEQRLGLTNKSRSGWRNSESIEQRIEAHIDALIIGEEAALTICSKRVQTGDYGELFGAVSVFCRQNLQDRVESVLAELDFDDNKSVKAATDALCYEWPVEWEKTFLPKMLELAAQTTPLITIIAEIAAYRRLPIETGLLNLLSSDIKDEKEVLSLIHAFDRLQSQKGLEHIFSDPKKYGKDCVYAAISALMRSGNISLIKKLTEKISLKDLPDFSAGLYGSYKTPDQIIDSSKNEHILSTALLGLTYNIPHLITKLGDSNMAENISIALDLITGAGLYENIFIKDEIDKDMLLPAELEKLKKGEPLYPEGQEPGVYISRISQDAESWTDWWSSNKGAYTPGLRYRCGKLYSPEVLVEIIDSNNHPNYIRRLAADELLIRYDINLAFETYMPVENQQTLITNLKETIKNPADRFEPGKWYWYGEENPDQLIPEEM